MNDTFFRELPLPALIANRDAEVIKCNDSFCRLTGSEQTEYAGAALSSITDEAGARYLLSAIQAEGSVPPREISIICPKGGKLALSAVYPYQNNFMISLTETTRMTDISKSAFPFQVLTESGGRLTDIAHQWKQPLNSLSLVCADFADDVRMGMADSRTADRFSGEYIGLINHMASTVMDFLEYMTPGSGQDIFDVRDCMPLIFSLMEPQFKKSGIRYTSVCCCGDRTCDISRTGEPRCDTKRMLMRGSRGTLQQALINLVGNAAEAVKDKQRRNIELELTENDGMITITVRDTGGGIPEEHLKSIFTSGFSTKNRGSSGLGLYITKNIVTNLYKGSIRADNRENGAEFTLSFSSCCDL